MSALEYSTLDTKRLPVYRMRLKVQEWACVAEALAEAPHGICDTGREALADWMQMIATGLDDQPRRPVVFEAPAPWADLIWYVLTSPQGYELQDIARTVRAQIQRANREEKARNQRQYWDSVRAMVRAEKAQAR